MKTNNPRPAHASSDAASAAAADPTVASPAAAPCGQAQAVAYGRKTEVGYTLQTLIVTAVFVLAAVGVGIGLLAINSSSSSDFEEAGRTGVERRCMPNEVKDPDQEARGVNGINPVYRGTASTPGGITIAIYRTDDQIVADNIGCNPICGTWEYFDPGRAAAGIGGPDGSGGIYSTARGCFAPCYWTYTRTDIRRASAQNLKDARTSWLEYFDDNRAPIPLQVRLGVNYRRSANPDADLSSADLKNRMFNNDLQVYSTASNRDGKPFFITRDTPPNGNRRVAGTLPVAPQQIASGLPAVFKPNWLSRFSDPGGTARNGGEWEDENWEVRADPYNKICTIVNTTLDDAVVCSSEWKSCGEPS